MCTKLTLISQMVKLFHHYWAGLLQGPHLQFLQITPTLDFFQPASWGIACRNLTWMCNLQQILTALKYSGFY